MVFNAALEMHKIKPKNWFSDLFSMTTSYFSKLKVLWRYITVSSFIHIAFVVVKLKILKSLLY